MMMRRRPSSWKGKVVLFSESMVSGGNIDGREMGELAAAGWGFQGKGA